VNQELLASVIISTYNRCEALVQTLQALGRQTIPPNQYEIIVVDDGSSDDTYAIVSEMSLPCALHVFRHPENRGVSAGRNLALRHGRGKYLILVSDDLLTPENFIATHLETLERFPGYWVVGGFEQLNSLTETPFGRYLDRLEHRFEEARKAAQFGPDLWELTWPTARNLSLPRVDFERIGPFDEQFRTTCEDQDWTHRARDLGIRFLYNATITCLHNDQAGDLNRYCRFQQRGARDTVLFCAKYPAIHGGAPVARLNGYITRKDGLLLGIKKALKALLATKPMTYFVVKVTQLAEALRAPDPWLWRLYQLLIGIAIFRGWREGLILLRSNQQRTNAPSLGYYPKL
jgi:glycosyltransferase involved in cell wall biosynthesis